MYNCCKLIVCIFVSIIGAESAEVFIRPIPTTGTNCPGEGELKIVDSYLYVHIRELFTPTSKGYLSVPVLDYINFFNTGLTLANKPAGSVHVTELNDETLQNLAWITISAIRFVVTNSSQVFVNVGEEVQLSCRVYGEYVIKAELSQSVFINYTDNFIIAKDLEAMRLKSPKWNPKENIFREWALSLKQDDIYLRNIIDVRCTDVSFDILHEQQPGDPIVKKWDVFSFPTPHQQSGNTEVWIVTRTVSHLNATINVGNMVRIGNSKIWEIVIAQSPSQPECDVVLNDEKIIKYVDYIYIKLPTAAEKLANLELEGTKKQNEWRRFNVNAAEMVAFLEPGALIARLRIICTLGEKMVLSNKEGQHLAFNCNSAELNVILPSDTASEEINNFSNTLKLAKWSVSSFVGNAICSEDVIVYNIDIHKPIPNLFDFVLFTMEYIVVVTDGTLADIKYCNGSEEVDAIGRVNYNIQKRSGKLWIQELVRGNKHSAVKMKNSLKFAKGTQWKVTETTAPCESKRPKTPQNGPKRDWWQKNNNTGTNAHDWIELHAVNFPIYNDKSKQAIMTFDFGKHAMLVYKDAETPLEISVFHDKSYSRITIIAENVDTYAKFVNQLPEDVVIVKLRVESCANNLDEKLEDAPKEINTPRNAKIGLKSKDPFTFPIHQFMYI